MTEPLELAMFPLESALLPDQDLPLRIFEPRYGALVRHCMDTGDPFGVVLISRGREVGGGDAEGERAGLRGLKRDGVPAAAEAGGAGEDEPAGAGRGDGHRGDLVERVGDLRGALRQCGEFPGRTVSAGQ